MNSKLVSREFPQDRFVTLLFKDGKKKKELESHVLINYHGWTSAEVRISQKERAEKFHD